MSYIVGLTGQSGAGKTTICEFLSEAGFGIINCDNVARECTCDGSACNKELAKVFPSCFDEKMSINRKGISEIIFSDRNKLKEFDDIVYPFINKSIDEKIALLLDVYNVIVLDAPTLFEAGADKKCKAVIGVVAKRNIRLERITARDRISKELALKRFQSQQSTKFFKEHCEFLIENNDSPLKARIRTERIIRIIKERSNG